jgi:hypothetical protein
MPLQISIYNRQKQTSANGKEYIGRALAFAPGQRGAISDTCEQPPFYIRDQRGDKQWIRLEARTLADAKVEAEKQQRILQALARGVEIAQANDDDKQRLTNQVAVFLAETEANKSLATWAAYNRSLELFLESCKRLNVSDVKREDLLQFKTYLKKKEFSGRTVYNNFLNVCIFLAWAKHPAEGLGIIDMDGLRWVGDLLANSFPELKHVVHSYPIQLRPAVGDDELHRACLHEFSNEALVKVPNASTVHVPLSSQSSVSGNFVTIRWSGFNPSAFRPSSRIYHDLVQVPWYQHSAGSVRLCWEYVAY